MLIFLWNPDGFHVVTMLPPRTSLNIPWFINEHLVLLVEKFPPAGWSAGRRKLEVPIDNAPTHNSRTTYNFFGDSPPKRLSHPPYFPDISRLDFYLYGKIEIALIGREISNEIDLLEAISDILNGSSDALLQHLFRFWIERVERVIDTKGVYLTS
jgi:hypothetical protein